VNSEGFGAILKIIDPRSDVTLAYMTKPGFCLVKSASINQSINILFLPVFAHLKKYNNLKPNN
jgi:hypothetical protein